jgi:hypothetical protein
MADQDRLSLEKELLELLQRRQGIQKDTLEDSRDFANVLQSQTKEITEQVIQRNKIRSLSREAVKQAEDLYSITRDELGTTKSINDLAKKRQDLEKIQIQLSTFRNQKLSEDHRINQDIQESIEGQLINTQKLLKEVKELETTSSKVANNFGVKTFGALSDITKKIPGLNRFSKPFEDAAEAARKVSQNNLGIDNVKKLQDEGKTLQEALDIVRIPKETFDKGKLSPFLAGIKSIGPSLAKAFGPAAIIFELVQAFLKLDQLAGNTAKSMGISYSQATQLNSEFNSIANSSGNIFVTTKGINESFNQINQALGTNGKLSEELLVTQTELVKQAFYSVEAATMLSKLSLATGKPTKEITTQFLGQAKALNLVNNTAINEKQLLESISKVSKATLATFASQPGKLAEAAFEAKKLGLELNQIEAIQSSLLDIESSIAAEFEAEVLTGKQLNLERARYYALTNDIAGLSKELGAQGITQSKFAGMNVIQQEAVAKAMGMSRDTMGGMLLEQEAILKLSQGDTEENRKKLAMLKERGFSMQAIAELGQEELDRQMESASMQDRFNASIEKLKEVFVSLINPLMPVLDVFSVILNVVGMIMKPIGFVFEKMSALGPVLGGIVKLISAAAIAAFMLTTSLTGGLAAAGILAAIGGGMALYQTYLTPGLAEGGTVIGEGSVLVGEKGPEILSMKPGATVTPLTKTNAATINIPSVLSPQPQAPMIDYDKIAQAISRVTVQTNLDGVRVSSELQKAPLGMATRKI